MRVARNGSRRATRLALWLFVSVLGLSGPAFSDLTLNWYTIDGGGGHAAGGAFDLQGTIGQADAGELHGGDFVLSGGFWPQASSGSACPGDTDGDGDVDLSDLALLLSEFGQTGSGFGGDVDCDGDVDLSDLAVVLGRFGKTCQE